jgi:hypothetical protein
MSPRVNSCLVYLVGTRMETSSGIKTDIHLTHFSLMRLPCLLPERH